MLRTKVKGQWREDKSYPVVFSTRCNDSQNDLLSRDCVGLEIERYSCVSATDICSAVLNWTRRKYPLMRLRNFSMCCWGCSTRNEWRSQYHSLLYTHPFPKRISVIVMAHKHLLQLFNKLIQRKRFTVSSIILKTLIIIIKVQLIIY